MRCKAYEFATPYDTAIRIHENPVPCNVSGSHVELQAHNLQVVSTWCNIYLLQESLPSYGQKNEEIHAEKEKYHENEILK